MSRSNRIMIYVFVLSTLGAANYAVAQTLRLPFVNIDRSNGQVRVQAPFVDVYRGNGVTSVRAPFTNVVRPAPQVQYYRTPYGLRPYYVYPQQTYVQPQTVPQYYSPQQLQTRSYRPTTGATVRATPFVNTPNTQPNGPTLVPPTPVPDAIGSAPQLPLPTPGSVPFPQDPTSVATTDDGPQLIPIPQTPLDAPDTLDQLDPPETPNTVARQQTQALLTPPAPSPERRVAKTVDYAVSVEIDSAVKVLNSNRAKAPSKPKDAPKEDEDGFIVVRSRSSKSDIQQVSAEEQDDDAGRIDEQPHYTLVLNVNDGDDIPDMKVAKRTATSGTPASGSTSYRLIAIPHSDLEDHLKAQAGVHVFAVIHPTTREPLVVKLQLPDGQPKFDVRRDRVVLNYDDIERTVFFTSDGDVIVKEQ